ncbi:MAG: class I SAM-dependent methyltransferase [Candidatus Thorarchaeota archaeon]
MVRKEFLVYDYHYEIPCDTCGRYHAALDYAEYCGTHPFQNGDIQPEGDISVWKPISQGVIESQEFPHKAWGSERIISMGRTVSFKRLDSLGEHSSKSAWDVLAPHWLTVEEENYHHKYRILPDVYRMLDVQKNEKILDVACGKGDVARHLARSGAKVTGIDISKMLDYAIESEERDKLGISYLNLNADRLAEELGEASFDKVVCNMALMDIEDFESTIKQIALVMKEDGVFVFSILHPAFSFPASTGRRIPEDSERNEDRIRFILDYFDDRPVIDDFGGAFPSYAIHFQRTVSTYLNELVKNKLVFREMSEPQVGKELVKKFPRKAYWDDEKRPEFLIVKAMKISDI